MSEFPNPCPAGGVFADSSEEQAPCPVCGRVVFTRAGRWDDHSRPEAFLVLGWPTCPVCREVIEDDACEQDGEFVHVWCLRLSDDERRSAGADDAAGDRFDREVA